MEAYGIESSVLDGKKEFNELFKFVKKQSYELDSYEIEKEIFKRLMKIGLSALKLYFAEKGTGDIGHRSKNEILCFIRYDPGKFLTRTSHRVSC